MNKKLVVFSFSIYLIILIWIIFFKVNIIDWINASINLMAKYSIFERFKKGIIPFYGFKLWKVKAYILNILIFIPFPIYLKMIYKNATISSFFIAGLLTTIIIELIQLYLPFCGFAVEDIICNSTGVLIGIIIIKLFKHKFSFSEINNLVFGSVIFMLPICLYAIIKTIINFEVYII